MASRIPIFKSSKFSEVRNESSKNNDCLIPLYNSSEVFLLESKSHNVAYGVISAPEPRLVGTRISLRSVLSLDFCINLVPNAFAASKVLPPPIPKITSVAEENKSQYLLHRYSISCSVGYPDSRMMMFLKFFSLGHLLTLKS